MGPKVFLSHIMELIDWTGINGFAARIRGKRPAVDGYVWLHELVYAYAEDNYRDDYEPIVAAFMDRIQKVLRYGALPFIVFDGKPLPGKAANKKRGEKRMEALTQLDEEFIRRVANGENETEVVADFDSGVLHAANAIKPDLVRAVIVALRERGVRYAVAPYEADAQIAQLHQQELVDCCITNDADLIIYGLPLVFFCTSSVWITGNCRFYDASGLSRLSAPKSPLLKLAKTHGAAPVFRLWAGLVGCDYDSCAGIGPVKAIEALKGASSKGHGTRSGGSPVLTTDGVVQAAAGGEPRAKKKTKKTQRSANVEKWAQSLGVVLDCYTTQVVYDTAKKQDVHLAFAPTPTPPHVGSLASGNVDVPVEGGGMPITMTNAEAAALGHAVTGVLQPLPPVVSYIRDGATQPTALCDELVLERPPLRLLLSKFGTEEEKNAAVTTETNLRLIGCFEAAVAGANGGSLSSVIQKPDLLKFLLSRNVTGLSQLTWPQLAAAAINQLKLEQKAIQRSEGDGREIPTFVVRDVTGRSLHEITSERAADPSAADKELKINDQSQWVTKVELLSSVVPFFDDGFIEKYFSNLGAEKDPNVRVLSRGYAHVSSRHRLSYCGFHPSPVPHDAPLVALRAIIPASRNNQSYCVTIFLRYFTDANGKMRFAVIAQVHCCPADARDVGDHNKWCRNSKSGQCTHCSACLFAFDGLPRSARAGSASVTEGLQMWHVPTTGTKYDPYTNVALLPITKPDRKRPKGKKRVVVSMVESAGRAGYRPLPKEKSILLAASRGSKERETARAALYAALRSGGDG